MPFMRPGFAPPGSLTALGLRPDSERRPSPADAERFGQAQAAQRGDPTSTVTTIGDLHGFEQRRARPDRSIRPYAALQLRRRRRLNLTSARMSRPGRARIAHGVA
jgi:hypothetical protein